MSKGLVTGSKMHFLNQIVESPILKDSEKNFRSVHRHFYKYSRGEFLGPALKIAKIAAKITLKGTHEYEDLILELVAQTIPDGEVEIKGVLIAGSDISKTITDLGFDWDLKKSTGQTISYKADILGIVNKDLFLQSIETFREHGYYLISFNINPNCKVSTKNKIPQPSKKKMEEDDVNARIQFCTGYLNTNDKNLAMVVDQSLPDFKSELPERWKSITIFNNYKIKEIEIPKEIKDTNLLRMMAIRKGILIRSIDIDGELLEKQYNIVV